MPLNFQNIPLVFGSGLDTITHPTQVPVGKLTQLENGVFTQGGAINKRFGYEKFSNNVFGSESVLSSAIATTVYNETDLLLFDINEIYSWIPSLDSWRSRGSCTALQVNSKAIQSDSNQQINSDTASNNDLQVIAWLDSSGGVRYSIIDLETKTQILTNHLLTNNALSFRCLSFSSYLIIGYATNDGRVQVAIISPQGTNTIYPLVSDTTIPAPFEMLTSDGYLALITNSSSDSDNAKIFLYDNLFAELDNYTSTHSAVNFDITSFSGGLSFTYASDDGYIVNIATSVANGTIATPTESIMEFASSSNSTHIATVEIEDGIIDVYLDTLLVRSAIFKGQFNLNTNSNNIPSSFLRSVSLFSKVFQYNNRQYFITNLLSSIQPTYFIINNLGEVVAKAEPSIAGPPRTSSNLAQFINTSNGVFETSISTRGQIYSSNQNVFTSIGVNNLKLDFNTNYHSVNFNNSLYLTGGILQQYDGNKITEQGFHYFPEGPIGTVNVTSGLVEAGVYSYQFTYEWIDNLGKVERSAPSVPVEIDVLFNFSSVSFIVPTLGLTKKDSVKIVMYRTKKATSGDPLLYQVVTYNLSPVNDTSEDYVVITDTYADIQIAANNVLYCSPDTNAQLIELENIAAPNCTLITVYKNRVFLAGTDDPNTIWYSKTSVPGEALAFNDQALILQINSVGGPITGLSVLDDNLVIFKENAIFTLSGFGPTNAGTQNDFEDPQQLASAIGCSNSNSIALVSSDHGLFFQSSKGIWKLDRQTGVSYVGAPVKAYETQNIVSGDQVPGTTQVRFLCSNGNTLVYDYFWQQWSTFTIRGIDAGIYNNKYYYVKNSGKVYIENDTYYDDNKSIYLSLTTGQFSFAGLQGYQRMESFLFLGDYIGPHKLIISFAYNGSTAFTESHVMDTSEIFDIGIFGEQNIYGQNSPFGGSFYNEQFRIFSENPVNQRVQIRIKEIDILSAPIYLINDEDEQIYNDEDEKLIVGDKDYPASGAVNLVAMLFKVGIKQGLGRIRSDQQG